MINFKQSDYVKQLPIVQMISLIDVLFVTLSFFMALFLHFKFESELNIAVPKAASSSQSNVASEDLVVNISKEGKIVVNNKPMSLGELTALLKQTGELYPNQALILRADQKTYHESVVRVLDACAKAKIWNISFATTQ